jgi:hypothetical protein
VRGGRIVAGVVGPRERRWRRARLQRFLGQHCEVLCEGSRHWEAVGRLRLGG